LNRSSLRIQLLGIAVLTFASITALSCAQKQLQSSETVIIRLEPGTSASAIARILAEKGIIAYPRLFLLRLRIFGQDQSIKAGTYRFVQGSSQSAVIRALIDGDVARKRLTIPEGSTAGAIARLLDDAELVDRADFLSVVSDAALASELGIPGGNLEGYLFPDTYDFELGASAKSVAIAMTRRFFTEVAKIAPDMVAVPGKLRERLILASIVEREYRIADEAPLIASVFDNRLRIGMALQSCATVVYALTERMGRPHPDKLYYADLAIDDPYNTYRHRGLPPGPISNPGSVALKAVFDHPMTDYLYFRVVDEARGAHRFSTDFEEHKGGIPVKGL
ncbi:MAG TPA: endolytic transglycosylase MltG, partial [Rectinemataceae bacterium]